MIEMWMNILGFEHYQISTYGRVKRTLGHRKDLGFITPRIRESESGYKYWLVKLRDSEGKRYGFSLHRLMYQMFIGPIPEKMCIDHIDRNTQNNDLSNLRLATKSENGRNMKCRVGKQYKGLQKTKSGKFNVRISCNGKTTCLGTYNTELEAAQVYNKYITDLHGDFAVLNELPGEIH